MKCSQYTNTWFVCMLSLVSFAVLSTGCAASQQIQLAKPRIEIAPEYQQAIEIVTQRHLNNFKLCVIRHETSSLMKETLETDFTISPQGKALEVEILSPEFRMTDLGLCIERTINWIQFPRMKGDYKQVRLSLALDRKKKLHIGFFDLDAIPMPKAADPIRVLDVPKHSKSEN